MHSQANVRGNLPVGHAGNQVAHLATVPAYCLRSSGSYFEIRNVPLLQSDLVAFGLTSSFLSLLGVSTQAVDVRFSVQAEHLWRRREREARSIIDAIPEAMARVKYIGGRDTSQRTERIALGECSGNRLLCCIIKFVPAQHAKSGTDEAWMSTAYFVRQAELRRLLRRKGIRPSFKNS
jgi:hypothetical protein